MSVATITLSSKGQIVIPKEIRDQLHWDSGTQITLFAGASGITLKAVQKKTGRRLEDLIGMLKHEGPSLSTEELCAPVDYSEDWAASERRSK
jgi:AbrB family looped-hinge helix DNA binding protein